MFEYANNTFGLPEVQDMMQKESFDLIIGGAIASRLMSGFAAHFKCPMVVLMPVKPLPQLSYIMGNELQLSTSPSMMVGFRNPMSFIQRVINVLVTGVEMAVLTAWDYFEAFHYDQNFPVPKYPNYWDVSRNISMILSAHHFSQAVTANIPAIVEIGGIQMDAKLDSLPEYLQNYLDNAKEGVIFFSFGTNVRIKTLDQMKFEGIIKALGRMNMKVLLKYDTDEKIPGLPKNILIASWLPQKEILGNKEEPFLFLYQNIN